jgi:hypothetical protein
MHRGLYWTFRAFLSGPRAIRAVGACCGVRHCRFCIHFDHALGQSHLQGKTIESEAEANNLAAQQLLMADYVWDVGGREVRIAPEDLGACDVHESYVFPNGTCGSFARTRGGELPNHDKPVAPEGLTGWRQAARDTEETVS